MKSITVAILSLTLVALAVPAAADTTGTFQPNPSDLNDLPHDQYFTWGVTVAGDFTATQVTSATLTFRNIYDWTCEPNKLYVHLLDTAPLGVKAYTDNEGGGDNFAGQGISLVTYTNLPTTAQTLVYSFSADQLATLNQDLRNGNDFALGLDPDCHYYNDGVTLQLSYGSPVPEPGALSLIMLGGLSLLAKRFRGKK